MKFEFIDIIRITSDIGYFRKTVLIRHNLFSKFGPSDDTFRYTNQLCTMWVLVNEGHKLSSIVNSVVKFRLLIRMMKMTTANTY